MKQYVGKRVIFHLGRFGYKGVIIGTKKDKLIVQLDNGKVVHTALSNLHVL